eukprot:1176123-Prorocentrum_minimum.AAC.7
MLGVNCAKIGVGWLTPTPGRIARHRTVSVWPVRVPTQTPFCHCLMVLSDEAVSTSPLGRASTASTEPSWPVSTFLDWPPCQILPVESTDADNTSPEADTSTSMICTRFEHSPRIRTRTAEFRFTGITYDVFRM